VVLVFKVISTLKTLLQIYTYQVKPMITIVRAKDGTIKTFSERENNDYNQALEETIEHLDTTMEEYAARFMLSCNDRSGETIQVVQGSGDLLVYLRSTERPPLAVSVNGLLETVALVNGFGTFTLSTDVPGLYIIEPADRAQFCAAGEGKLVIEVLP
jgi:hypothetical protein